MNRDEIDRALIVPRGNNKSVLRTMHILLLYRALYGEEKFKEFLEALDKDMKKDGFDLKAYLNLKDYTNKEESK